MNELYAARAAGSGLCGRASTVELLLEELLPGAAPPNLAVDAQDSSWRCLRELHHGAPEAARVSYFRSGWSAMRVVDQVLDWRFGRDRDRARILDFGSGYGRVTRFVVQRHPRERVCVADVLPDAVAFQRDRFGVRTLLSSAHPDDLDLVEVFDLVVVFSVFSHLARESFGRWLRRLWSLVAPGGVLVFSTLGEASMLPGRVMSEDGFCFDAFSHLPELAAHGYGSTWVRETFVRDLLCSMLGSDDAWLRLPCALWAHQDLYLVAKREGGAFQRFAFRWEPMGRLEECTPRHDGELHLGGWACDPGGEAVESVEVVLEGQSLAEARPTEPRADVARHLGTSQERLTGWSLDVAKREAVIDFDDRLMIRVRSRSGECFVAHLATVEATLLALELDRLHRELGRLHHEFVRERKARGALWYEVRRVRSELRRVERMLALSRFWKARNLWWRLRRRVGTAS